MSTDVDPIDAGLAVAVTIIFGFIALLIYVTVEFGGAGALTDLAPGIVKVALLIGGIVAVAAWLRSQF